MPALQRRKICLRRGTGVVEQHLRYDEAVRRQLAMHRLEQSVLWKDPTFIVTVIACIAGVVAAVYAYLPYRTSSRSASRRQFITEREYLIENRGRLTANALELFDVYASPLLPGVLSLPEWVPEEPLPLKDIAVILKWEEGPPPLDAKIGQPVKLLLPWMDASERFKSYSAALGELAKPKLYQDLPCYRLTSAKLRGQSTELHVGMTTFFRGIDESEALAHEFAKASKQAGSPLNARSVVKLQARRAVGNRFASDARSTIMSVSALTIRVSESGATFFLHSRDPEAVAIAGSLLHLAPSGVFQPTSDEKAIAKRDCAPWLTLCREYAEEFLGVEEAQGAAGVALSYTHDEPYASINRAYTEGALKVYALGVGLDPLTLCPELITVACFEADAFDDVFKGLVSRNVEGNLRGKEMRSGQVVGYDFDLETIDDLKSSKRLSPAASAALSRAWGVREKIVAPSL